MTPERMRALLPQAWSWRSSGKWRPENPARGQCGMTALLVQDELGGDILKTRVGEAWHFYNRLGGERHDLTDSQFEAPVRYDDLPSSRDEALADGTPAQYAALCAAWQHTTAEMTR